MATEERCPTCQHSEAYGDGCHDAWHRTPPVTRSEPGQNTRLQKWVDPAMYAAVPVPEGGPRVFLLAATADPLGVIAAAAELYTGGVVHDLAEVTHAQRKTWLAELQKTKIKAPLEFVQFHFLIEGVTRGFTHQLVRQRTATFVQESLRFAVKEDVPVGLPPSVQGTTQEARRLYQEYDAKAEKIQHEEGPYSEGSERQLLASREYRAAVERLPAAERWRATWDNAEDQLAMAYQKLIDNGMPAEDARGLLPTNTLTRVHYSTDLRALLDQAGNRLCTQAQFEWREVFARIAMAIRHYDPLQHVAGLAVRGGDEHTHDALMGLQEIDRWQWEALAALLRPVCYATGKCEFMSAADRACSIRERVQANAAAGRPSSFWGQHGNGNLKPIDTREWLLDPGAAR